MIVATPSFRVRVALLSCALISVPVASAQEVRGVVHIAGAAAGARGASVVLLDSAGTVVRGVLTDDDGRFTIHAMHAGRYRVRARQIGFSPDSSGLLELRVERHSSADLSLRRFSTSLGAVNVTERRRCSIAPAAGSAALRLWDEVQSALTAAAITSGTANDVLLTNYTREIDPVSRRVVRATSWQTRASGGESYRAVPADSLAAHGFVVSEGQNLVYYAPDASTLTSETFARTHCFRPALDAQHPGLAGLAFAPVRTSGTGGDVSGVLWLDDSTFELRRLEFAYDSPYGSDGSALGDASGRIDYARLPSGAWIVQHWQLRVPVVVTHDASVISSGASLQVGAPLVRARVAQVVATWEIGGDVTADSSAATTMSGDGSSTIEGDVVDSADTGSALRPVAGVRARLSRVGAEADTTGAHATIADRITDANGRFRFDSVPAGEYTLHLETALLDSLAAVIADRSLSVGRAMRITVGTTLPSRASAVRRLCGDTLQTGNVAVYGRVRDSIGGAPLGGARVAVKWFENVVLGGPTLRHFSATERNAVITTSTDGRYAFCTLPLGRPLYVTASVGARRAGVTRLEPSPDRVRPLDVTVGEPPRK